ncbi:GNAT family N-acetyltransferase [Bifidobacterium choloepi]|nr:GNAT family N-acetyltransferase [Bifidobacterium choloepi]
MDDLDALATMEAACFPPAEAADIETLASRIEQYPEHFWLLINTDAGKHDPSFPAHVEEGSLISFVNGLTTDEADLLDTMYDDASLHDEDGDWQMILGLDTAPIYQHHGCAGYLLRRVILDSALSGRRGIVLACKERLVDFYASFGFVDENLSSSTHGNAAWHQMRLLLTPQVDEEPVDRERAERTDETIRRAMRETTRYIDSDESITQQFPAVVRH